MVGLVGTLSRTSIATPLGHSENRFLPLCLSLALLIRGSRRSSARESDIVMAVQRDKRGWESSTCYGRGDLERVGRYVQKGKGYAKEEEVPILGSCRGNF